jgi:hypothetical protein
VICVCLLDIDECALNIANCGRNSACQNTIGSYMCVRTPVESCPPGYRFDNNQQICSGELHLYLDIVNLFSKYVM